MTADVTGSLFDRGSSVGGPIKIESNQIRLADLIKKNIIFGLLHFCIVTGDHVPESAHQ